MPRAAGFLPGKIPRQRLNKVQTDTTNEKTGQK